MTSPNPLIGFYVRTSTDELKLRALRAAWPYYTGQNYKTTEDMVAYYPHGPRVLVYGCKWYGVNGRLGSVDLGHELTIEEWEAKCRETQEPTPDQPPIKQSPAQRYAEAQKVEQPELRMDSRIKAVALANGDCGITDDGFGLEMSASDALRLADWIRATFGKPGGG